uniref:ATP synthase F(0) complex subunit a n=1 Tax=Moschus moschiferus TaxID=68415 RepID=A0A8C6D3B4_MOSMO
ILVIIETISLYIQPMALAIRLTANITAGHLLIHLIRGATLALISISTTTALITFIILVLLTIILEFAVAIIQAYVFTLLVSLYLHDNT